MIPFFGNLNLSIGDSLLNVAISLLIMGVKKQFTIQFYFYDIFLLTERFFNSYYFFSSFSKHFMESYKLVKLQTLSEALSPTNKIETHFAERTVGGPVTGKIRVNPGRP